MSNTKSKRTLYNGERETEVTVPLSVISPPPLALRSQPIDRTEGGHSDHARYSSRGPRQRTRV